MEKVLKKGKNPADSKHPLDRRFSSAEEAAQAKSEYLMRTVFRNADWGSLKK